MKVMNTFIPTYAGSAAVGVVLRSSDEDGEL